MKTVNQSMRKKDAMQLVTGQPVYMDDVIPQDCLIVKLLRSPHANAIVQEIDTSRALLKLFISKRELPVGNSLIVAQIIFILQVVFKILVHPFAQFQKVQSMFLQSKPDLTAQ